MVVEQETIMFASKTDANLRSDLFERWVKHFLREKVLHDGLHDGQDVSVFATCFATLFQSQAFQSLDEVISS